jgi:hypothetical protein
VNAAAPVVSTANTGWIGLARTIATLLAASSGDPPVRRPFENGRCRAGLPELEVL